MSFLKRMFIVPIGFYAIVGVALNVERLYGEKFAYAAVTVLGITAVLIRDRWSK